MNQQDIACRFAAAHGIVSAAATTALRLFGEFDSLTIERKGRQDWVSEADRGVEREIRDALGAAFPEDGIIGEEHADTAGDSGFTWVIDPIDGTTLFVNGAPGWCVVLAGVHRDETVLAVIIDPIARETFLARRGHGATLNGQAMRISAATGLEQGTVSVGHSARVSFAPTLAVLSALLEAGGLYQRTGSGASCLCMVAAGRLLGYVESHMNAWDCLAAMLLVEEAGGRVEPFGMPDMLRNGGRVVAGAPGVYDALHEIADKALVPMVDA